MGEAGAMQVQGGREGGGRRDSAGATGRGSASTVPASEDLGRSSSPRARCVGDEQFSVSCRPVFGITCSHL